MNSECMCENLSFSPMFNLSMASKELFHSNFLYWLSQTYPEGFKEVMRRLGVKTNGWPEDWMVQREVDHFDLSVVRKNDPKDYLLILENKVKSIPNIQQLNDYKNKVNNSQDYLLLSLTTEFPNKDAIEKNEWKISNYQDLAIALYGIVDNVKEQYHRYLILDYCSYITCLHGWQKGWVYDLSKSYNQQFVNIPERIYKMGDVKKKVLYSRLAVDIIKNSGYKFGNNKDIVEDTPKKPGDVFINWGMTRGTGLIDVKMRIQGDVMLVIQLQGNILKHCIEVLGKNVQDKGLLSELSNNRKCKTVVNSFGVIIDRLIKTGFFCVESNKVEKFYLQKYEKPDTKNLFNAYNDTFFYQYVKIADDTTVEDVLQAINKNIEDIKKDYPLP